MKKKSTLCQGRLSEFLLHKRKISAQKATLTSMGAELQSQNRVDVDYEKTTGPIFLKF